MRTTIRLFFYKHQIDTITGSALPTVRPDQKQFARYTHKGLEIIPTAN